MARTLAARMLLACAVATAAAGAQAPIAAPALGEVRTPDGKPLRNAEVRLTLRPVPRLAWQASLAVPGEPLIARTDARGRFRFALPGAGSTGGHVLVHHRDGWGAYHDLVESGQPVRIRVVEASRVELRGVTRPSCHVSRTGPGGEPRYLGRFERESLHLPPGRYALLVESPERRFEAAVAASAGGAVIVEPPGAEARPLQLPASTRAWLRAWPMVELTDAIPLGPGPRAMILERRGERGAERREWWPPREGAGSPTPPGGRWREVTVHGPGGGAPAAGAATVYTLAEVGERWVVRGIATADRDGRAAALTSDGETDAPLWVVAVHDPNAPFACAEPSLPADGRLRLAPGHDVAVVVRGQDGDPTGGGGLPVELRSGIAPCLVFVTRTDRFGRARFRGVPAGRANLRLSSPRHVETRLPIDVDASAPVTRGIELEADPGTPLRGAVRVAHGDPAADVTIVVRDTTGTSFLGERTARTDASGEFIVPGIDPDALLTVSASLQRGAKTYSAQLRGVQSRAPCELVLRDEDPALPGKRKR